MEDNIGVPQEEGKDFKKLFEEDKRRREVAFRAYLEKGAKEYGCNIIPVVVITPKGVVPSVEIEAY